ncbi:AP2 domain transcription factor AP2III-4 [Besnoitia besnoiti]|uniref:AP2 domain transcription factor AP2III-4 n=1 Tax=Besnoitia besnoiti TaxID=94643 RepID=A0A2A9MB04_BESBE|nr:AP2 domain transcription factor AP2III-4 [Besnoitia besnoiti]PFH32560.1 AP2 domain transcription factor AP2III-4 [Besnoitia besnoiti]
MKSPATHAKGGGSMPPSGSCRRGSLDASELPLASPSLPLTPARSADGQEQQPPPILHGGRSWRSPGEVGALPVSAGIESPLISTALCCSPSLSSVPRRGGLEEAGKPFKADALGVPSPAAPCVAPFPSSVGEAPSRSSPSPHTASILSDVFSGLARSKTISAEPRSSPSAPAPLPSARLTAGAMVSGALALSPSLQFSSGTLNSCMPHEEQKTLCAGAPGATADPPLARLGAGAVPQLPPPMPTMLSNVRSNHALSPGAAGSARATPDSLGSAAPLSGHLWPPLSSAYCSRESLLAAATERPALVSGSAGFLSPALPPSFHCGKDRAAAAGAQMHPAVSGLPQLPPQTAPGAPGHTDGRESLPKVVGVRYDKVNKTWRASWYDPQSKRRVERKFSVNKLGFINAYNMATECRKLHEQKLGLRDRAGRKQQQQSKSPSVAAPPAVLVPASSSACVPQLELQRQQELLTQASSWAASQSLLAERLEKGTLQQFLPFDFEHALSSQRAPVGSAAAGPFSSSAEAAALAAFSAATDSFLAPQGAFRNLEGTPQRPAADLQSQHQLHLLSLAAAQPTVKPELQSGSARSDLSGMQGRSTQEARVAEPEPEDSAPKTPPENPGERLLSIRPRKRKGHPEEDSSSPPRGAVARLEGCGAQTGEGGEAQDTKDVKHAKIWHSGGGACAADGHGRNSSTPPSYSLGGACLQSGKGRHAHENEGTGGGEGTSSAHGQRDAQAGVEREESAGKAQKAESDERCASRQLCGREEAETGEPSAKNSRLPSSGQDESPTPGKQMRRGGADRETTDDDQTDGPSRESRAATPMAAKEAQSYRTSGRPSRAHAPQRERGGGECRPGRGEGEQQPRGERTHATIVRGSKEAHGEAAAHELKRVLEQCTAGRGERGDHLGKEPGSFCRTADDCGSRHCGDRGIIGAGCITPSIADQAPGVGVLSPLPRSAPVHAVSASSKRRTLLSASSFAPTSLLPSTFSLAAFALAAAPSGASGDVLLCPAARPVLPPLCASASSCRGSSPSPLSCDVACHFVSPGSRTGSGVCCCRRLSSALRESSVETPCCGRHCACACCGDDCRVFSRSLRHGYPTADSVAHAACGGRSLARDASPSSASPSGGRLAPSQKTGGTSGAMYAAQASASSSPSCCPRHHGVTDGAGEALDRGGGSSTCSCESGLSVSHARGESGWAPSCLLSLESDGGGAATGPLIILHLTKELVLLLLQSVQDAVRSLAAESPVAQAEPACETELDAGCGRSPVDAPACDEPDAWQGGDSSPDQNPGGPREKRERGRPAREAVSCEFSGKDAELCVAAIERHKDSVRLASHVESLGRYTKLFRACIKAKQVPTQLPHLRLLQLLRELLSMQIVEEERRAQQAPPHGSPAAAADNVLAHGVSSTESSSGQVSPAEFPDRLPSAGASCEKDGSMRAASGSGGTSGRGAGGRVSRVTTAATDEVHAREPDDEGAAEAVETEESGTSEGERRLTRGACSHSREDGGAAAAAHPGASHLPSLGAAEQGKGPVGGGGDGNERAAREEGEKSPAKQSFQQHTHNTRSRSHLAKQGGGGGPSSGNASRTGGERNSGAAASSSQGRPHPRGLPGARRACAGKRQQHAADAASTTGGGDDNQSSDSGGGQEERNPVKPEKNASGGLSASSVESRRSSQSQRHPPEPTSSAEKPSLTATSQLSPHFSPSGKIPSSFCFGDRLASESSSSRPPTEILGGTPSSADGDGLIEDQDYDVREGSSSREGDATVQDSLARLLL